MSAADEPLIGVINAGSSSLKFSIYEGEKRLLAGNINGIGVRPIAIATDANGDREIRLYFPGTMRARITNSITPADSEFRYVGVRATEYTQGSQGLAAMPAMLPPSSAYTYCVELSLDEADSLGAPARFTKDST